MKTLLAAVLLAMPALSFSQDWDARLHSVEGEVTVFSPDDAEGTAGEAGMPLEAGDRIETAAGAKAEVSFDGEGIVLVEESSSLEVSELGQGRGEVKLGFGALVAKFHSLVSGRQFRVRAHTAVAAVRGTEFGVETEGETAHVAVFDEGRVAVSAGGAEEVIEANQETSVAPGQRPARAAALKRFQRRRAHFKRLRRRHAGLRKAWRALTPEQRLKLRGEARERMKRRRRAMRGRIENGIIENSDREPGQRRQRPIRQRIERRRRGER